ncbi:hypothetical protein K402DRAFT_389225 [Aulographum hederae CBS 113979]|uniref:Uncharacterized protein n=1 Tax=Aulographum hederae CBS 113979 TaxID=1176131 RepID=A0A6G1HD76_9PEZI|nr:hypothetical protein K402DRAFT_389225 [Aulographum hederae CBS 113979]
MDESTEERITRENRERDDEIHRPARKVDVISNEDYARMQADSALKRQLIDGGFDGIAAALVPYFKDTYGPFGQNGEGGVDVGYQAQLLADRLRRLVVGIAMGEEEAGRIANIMRGLGGRELLNGGDTEEVERVKGMVIDIDKSFRVDLEKGTDWQGNAEKFSPMWKDDGKWTGFKTAVADAYLDGEEKAMEYNAEYGSGPV